MEPLWPSDIGSSAKIQAPLNVLKEQASLLGKMTKNLLEAEVESLSPINFFLDNDISEKTELLKRRKDFVYAFNIVAPALDSYQYRLFSIVYDINLYPVNIYLDKDILHEVQSSSYSSNKNLVAGSEDEFKTALKKIFGAKKTRRVIDTLISQSNATDSQQSPSNETKC